MRDLLQAWDRSPDQTGPNANFRGFEAWAQRNSPCVAAFLDPLGSVICGGRITMEHVTPVGGRMGKKAADREEELVSLCESHHLWSYAGYIWATANKRLTRAYLKELYG
jgi:hypothetical protein